MWFLTRALEQKKGNKNKGKETKKRNYDDLDEFEFDFKKEVRLKKNGVSMKKLNWREELNKRKMTNQMEMDSKKEMKQDFLLKKNQEADCCCAARLLCNAANAFIICAVSVLRPKDWVTFSHRIWFLLLVLDVEEGMDAMFVCIVSCKLFICESFSVFVLDDSSI